jgi:O-antigen/teichoic acid export membrane protein
MVGFLNVLILQPIMLQPEEIGLMRILYSTAILIGTIFPLGLNGAIIKFLPKFRNSNSGHDGFLGSVILLSLPVFLITCFFLWVFRSEFVDRFSHESPMFVSYFHFVLPMAFFIGYANLFSIYLFANFKSVFPSLVNDLFIRLYSTVIISLYFVGVFEAGVFFKLFLVGYFLQFLALFLYTRSTGEFSKILSPGLLHEGGQHYKALINFSLVMSIITISNMALKNIDVIMMGSYLNLEEVGVYSIAILVAGFIELPASAMGRIADSNIAQAFEEKRMDVVSKIYSDSTRLLMALGLLLFILINANINDLLSFLPPKYANGAGVVFIAGLASLSNMATGINSSLLFYTKHVRLGSFLLVGLLILNITLNYFLIPSFGIMGAAYSVAISFFAFNFLKFILIKRLFALNPYGVFVVWILIAGLIAYLAGLMASGIGMVWVKVIIRSIFIGGTFLFICYKTKVLPEFQKYLGFIFEGEFLPRKRKS